MFSLLRHGSFDGGSNAWKPAVQPRQYSRYSVADSVYRWTLGFPQESEAGSELMRKVGAICADWTKRFRRVCFSTNQLDARMRMHAPTLCISKREAAPL